MGKRILWVVLLLTLTAVVASASEADIKIPPLDTVSFDVMGKTISGMTMSCTSAWASAPSASCSASCNTSRPRRSPVHHRMRPVSNTIWETCKTYLSARANFSPILWVLIAACMVYYYFPGVSTLSRSNAAGGKWSSM